MQIHGKRAVVTGGCGGIGLAIAEQFLSRGLHVTLCDCDTTRGEALASKYDSLRLIEIDLAVPEEIESKLRRALTGPEAADILVNGVGISPKSDTAGKAFTTWDMPIAQWDRVMAVNLTAYFLCTRLVLPSMIERRGGRIINIASLAARTGGYIAPVHYVVSKAGVLGLTKVAAKEAGRFGITVNAINPGRIDTDMIHDVDDSVNEAYIERIPVGRLGLPDDVAKIVVFLASDLSDYLNGTAIEVNGGLYMGP